MINGLGINNKLLFKNNKTYKIHLKRFYTCYECLRGHVQVHTIHGVKKWDPSFSAQFKRIHRSLAHSLMALHCISFQYAITECTVIVCVFRTISMCAIN